MSLLDQFDYDADGGSQSGGYGGGGYGGGGGGYGGGGGTGSYSGSQRGGYDEEPDELLGNGGFVSTFQEDEIPLFQRRRVDFGPLPSGVHITHTASGSNTMILALSNNHLLKLDTNNPSEDRFDIDLGRRPEDRIFGLFIDPTASHILACVTNSRDRGQTETIYIPTATSKPISLKRFKGYAITSVAWSPDSRREDRSTREILLGTSNGLVFEAEIDKDAKYFKQVYRIDCNSDRQEPVLGLRVDRVKSLRSDANKCFIMITTPRQSFQFMGAMDPELPIFQNVLVNSQNRRYFEVPGEIPHSTLAFFAQYPSPPTGFAWMAGCGISYGDFDFKKPTTYRPHAKQEPIETVMKGEQTLWEYTKMADGRKPIAIAMTEFHIILLYNDQYDVLCLLNQKIVLSENFPSQARGMVGMAFDPVMETIYAFSPRALFKIESINEVRDIWQLYLDQGNYTEALKYCEDNIAHADKVMTAEAEDLFSKGEMIKSADTFAKTQRSFEEVALRFLGANETMALKSFLLRKLKTLGGKEKTQLTMLCSWLVEIYLNSLNGLKDDGDIEGYRVLQDEFREFLQDDRVRLNLDKPTAYDLIMSHGNVEDLTFFASLIEDFERVVDHHVQSGDFVKALDLLYQQPNLDLYYRFAPTLMQHMPRETVDTCMNRPELDPRQLIPAFIRYQQNDSALGGDSEASHQAIRYLEWCVGTYMKNRDPAIHNYLVSLYCKLPDDGPLLQFLERSGADAVYDQKYALRLCTQEHKKRACVAIYSSMKLYEEAVDHALTVDLELAMKNAENIEDDTDMRKKLWLRIAKHVVTKDKNIDQAMEVLKRSDDLLKIEDILPFFPDFVHIDDFKVAICTSLQEYNHGIEKLKKDMLNATESAKAIRNDIQELRNKYVSVSPNDTCEVSGLPLMSGEFIQFPCGTGYLIEFLIEEVKKYLKFAAKRKLEKIETALRASPNNIELKNELDEIIAEQCPCCGENLIELIDEPFIPMDNQNEYLKSWTLA